MRLRQWGDVVACYNLPDILIGNGASIAVWPEFGYSSLYKKAVSPSIENPLDEFCQAHFTADDTTNFEHILRSLKDAEAVLRRLPRFSEHYPAINEIQRQYDMIRQALSESVKAAHIPFNSVTQEQLLAIRVELGKYGRVYSTNYDLLIYWAIMAVGNRHFDDCFRGGDVPFDPARVEGSYAKTRVYYLHGALHIYLTPSGRVLKRTASCALNLLDLFGTEYKDGARPLIITEGKSEDKWAVISSNPYLRFGFDHLSRPSAGLVVFGHSLTLESDRHIIDAIKRRKPETLAISIYPSGTKYDIAAQTSLLRKQFEDVEVIFFDSRSHPLGSEDLSAAHQVNAFALRRWERCSPEEQMVRCFGTTVAPWADLG